MKSKNEILADFSALTDLVGVEAVFNEMLEQMSDVELNGYYEELLRSFDIDEHEL